MSGPSVSYRISGQTDPAIFAATHGFEPNAKAEGRYPQWAISLVLEGCCNWRVQNQEYVFGKGDLQLIRPDMAMSWCVPSNTSWRVSYAVFHPRPHWLQWLGTLAYSSGVARIRAQDELMQARIHKGMAAICRMYERGGPQRDDWTMLSLERMLLLLQAHAVNEKESIDPRVREAVEFMLQNYSKPLTLAEIARAALVSVSHLSLLFGQQLGASPMQYLERLRLERASQMLMYSADPVAEIAIAAGYSDPDYFARRFRQHTGFTPRAFRQARPAANAATPELWPKGN